MRLDTVGKSLWTRVKRSVFRPRIPVRAGFPLKRLGTSYGGWTFVDSPSLRGSTMVSCGLGEDASFDVAFAQMYGARVVIVDPTPRAIAHFEAMQQRWGMPAVAAQRQDGLIDPASYDLRGIDATRIRLIPRAVAETSGSLRFYAPPNPDHVSYSLINFQNEYSEDSPHILVEATTLSSILQGLEGVTVVKLDIEGSEAEVIPEMLARGCMPQQILAEFDELHVPSLRSRRRAESTDAALRASGYECVFHDGRTTFSYLRVSQDGSQWA